MNVLDRLDLMIDLECAGKAPDGAIVSIGWCVFDRDGKVVGPYGPMCHGRIDVIVDSAVDKGMKLDADTIAWWFKQEPSTRRLWNAPGAKPLDDALRSLAQVWYDRCQPNPAAGWVWAYPATYDLTILDRAYSLCGFRTPWERKNLMCSRSVMKALGFKRDGVGVPEQWRRKHDPEADAVRQVIQLQRCLNPSPA